jgi:putative ATP-binding cassette transporter
MRRPARHFFQRFLSLARPYWSSDERWVARGLLLLLVLLLIAETQFNVFFNEQSGELTSALAARDGPRFWRSIRFFFALLVVAVPIYAFYYFVRDQLAIRWRRWLSKRFLSEYLDNRAYYRLVGNPAIDNPDQRIAEDINAFTQKSMSFMLVVASASFQLLAFAGVLWSISKTLVAFLVLYAALGTLMTFGVFGKRLIALNFSQLKREADFRFGRVRENAESIAFYRGEEQEARELERRFARVFENFTRLIRWTLNLSFFQYAFSLVTLALPSVIIAPRVLSGELEVGRVVQAAGAFAAILAALTIFVDNFESLSRFVAGIDRLHGFENALLAGPDRGPGRRIELREDSRLTFDHVTVQTPDAKRELVRDLSLVLEPGARLLVVGPSGAGKSSLLRAVAGLWISGSGVIGRPLERGVLFAPQHPYMVLGTLREQLLYPGHEREIPDRELRETLALVNLPALEQQCGGLDRELDFDKVLSLGEQQRVAFARVFLARAKFVVLDEATSALDGPNEAALYAELRSRGAGVVSVSHRPQVLDYHDWVLSLGGHGEWRLLAASEYRFGSEAA